MNSKGCFSSPTVTCSALPSSFALLIGDRALLSDGSALLSSPASSSATWTETVAYRFRNIDQNPTSGLAVDSSGAVYGVTYVETYKFANGAFSVISSFSDIPPNGYSPTGGVVLDRAAGYVRLAVLYSPFR